MTPSAFREALPFFQRAVEIDPSFAQGWSRLAMCHFVQVFFEMAPADEMIPLSRAAAERSLELDDRNAGAHGALGGLALYFDWDWETAGRELELAIRLAPTDSMVRHGYADYLGVMGDVEGSLEQVMLGRLYDPMGLLANGVVLGHLFMAGRYEEVLAEGTALEKRFPDNPTIRNFQAAALWELGRYGEAVDKWAEYLGEDSLLVQTLRRGLAAGGPEEAMRLNAKRLAELSRTARVSPFDVARYYAQAGELDPAFKWLERAFQDRTPRIVHMRFDPRFAVLRADPRYGELLRRIGFPVAAPR
jgi:tetratricopeptide (TPR) repeat protein